MKREIIGWKIMGFCAVDNRQFIYDETRSRDNAQIKATLRRAREIAARSLSGYGFTYHLTPMWGQPIA